MYWKGSEDLKINHPYMGRMSFPENFDKPSRTITSTKITNSREALIYKDGLNRKGDGEYRTPTIREIAVLMSFPISYQFMGSENTKWRIVGNAVCPLVSGAIARATLRCLRRPTKKTLIVRKDFNYDEVNNLNCDKKNTFSNRPTRNQNARFRRHPFKVGNMTVTLSNYDIKKNSLADGKWRSSVIYGTGQGFKIQNGNEEKEQDSLRRFIRDNFNDGRDFLDEVHNGFSTQISSASDLQKMYERNVSEAKSNPVNLIEEARKMIDEYANGDIVDTGKVFHHKQRAHKRQLYAFYVLNHISIVANKMREDNRGI